MATSAYDELITKAATDLGVPVDLALAVSKRGEVYDPRNPESPKGAYGPMQVMPDTFSSMASKLGIQNPDRKNDVHNIYTGVAYLKEQLDRFQNPVLAVAAYNSGPGAVQKYGGIPPYKETQGYVQRVLGSVQNQATPVANSKNFQSQELVSLSAPQQGRGPFDPEPRPEKPKEIFIPWESVESNPSFRSLEEDQQMQVKTSWFDQFISPRPQFQNLNPDEKDVVKTNFFAGKRLPSPSQQAVEAPAMYADPTEIAAVALTGGGYGAVKAGARTLPEFAATEMFPNIWKEAAKGATEWTLASGAGAAGMEAGGKAGRMVGGKGTAGDIGEFVGQALGGTLPLVGFAKMFDLFGKNPEKVKPENVAGEYETEAAKIRRLLEQPEQRASYEQPKGREYQEANRPAEEPRSGERAQPAQDTPRQEYSFEDLVNKYRKPGMNDWQAAEAMFKGEGGMGEAAKKHRAVRDWLREQQVKAAQAEKARQEARYGKQEEGKAGQAESSDFEAKMRAHEENMAKMRQAAEQGGFASPAAEQAGVPAVRQPSGPVEQNPVLARMQELTAPQSNPLEGIIRALPIPEEIKQAMLVGKPYGEVGSRPVAVAPDNPMQVLLKRIMPPDATGAPQNGGPQEPGAQVLRQVAPGPMVNQVAPKQIDSPEIKLVGTQEKPVVKTDIPKSEADKLSPKEQKVFLLKEIDTAISVLPKDGVGVGGKAVVPAGIPANRQHEIDNAITFEVPGDGKFTVQNSKTALDAFKKAVSARFPTSEALPKQVVKQNPLPSGTQRITGGDISYYNEYKQRNASIDSWKKAGEKYKGVRTTPDGFVTDNRSAIKDKWNSKEEIHDVKVKDLVKGDSVPAELKAEMKDPHPKSIPTVHVVSENGKELIVDAKLVDAILTAYPNAKPSIVNDRILSFEKNGELVGAVMPMSQEGNADFEEWFAEAKRSGSIKTLSAKEALTNPLKSERGAISLPTRAEIDAFVNNWKEFWKPLSTIPQSQKFLEGRYKSFGDIARVGNLVKRVHDKTASLPEPIRKDMFRYMDGQAAIANANFDPGFAARWTLMDPAVQKLADRLLRLNDMVGEMMVKRGMMKRETFEKNKGQYIHYMYLKHVLGDDSPIVSHSGKFDLSELKKRKGLSDEAKKAIGQIEDVAVAEPTGLSKALSDIHKFDYFKSIAQNSHWTWQPSRVKFEGKIRPVGDLMDELEAMKRVDERMPGTPEVQQRIQRLERAISLTRPPPDAKENWRELKGKKWGPLNGTWVRKPVYRDLVPFFSQFESQGDMSQLLNSLLRIEETAMTVYKVGKTALNPPTLVRNIVSNIAQMHWSGVPLHKLMSKYIPGAVTKMREKSPKFRMAERHGVFKTNFAEAELGEVLDALRKAQGAKGALTQVVEFAQGVAKYYGKIDDVFKFAKFLEQIDNGASPAKAAVEAQKWGMDYSLAHPSVKAARRHIMPFVSYNYKILPLAVETAKKRPWLIGAMFMLPYLAAQFSMRQEGMTEEDWEKLKKSLPSHVRKTGSYLALPWKSPEGNIQWVDYSYFLPVGNTLQLEQSVASGEMSAILRNIGIGNPILNAISAISSAKGSVPRDPFSGQDIYNTLDPPALKAAKTMEWIYLQFGPNAFSSKGSLGKTIGIGDKDKWGRTITPEQAALSWFGVNIYAPTKTQGAIEKKARIKQLEADLIKVLTDPNISTKRKAEYQKTFGKRVAEIQKSED